MRESIVGLRASASATSESRSGPRRTTSINTEILVGVSSAAFPAAVGRSRRESLPITARSRAAVSVSMAVLVKWVISCLLASIIVHRLVGAAT
jgi:hypothetical protein